LNQNKNLSFDEKKDYFIERILPERCSRMRDMFDEMRAFIHTEPRLPGKHKEFVAMPRLQITTLHSRNDILEHIAAMASQNEFAELARYAYRDMEGISWIPFTKAAIERNPVSIEALKGKSIDEAYQILMAMPDESIYSDNRLAQPDELWNYGLGDGLEKAFALMIYIRHADANQSILLDTNGSEVVVTIDNSICYRFHSNKTLVKKVFVDGDAVEER